MYQNLKYATVSLDLHLFFARIMKEHSLFLMAGFTPTNSNFAEAAEHYKIEFENALWEAVCLSNGVVSQDVLNSGEIVTPFTINAEKQTECFTGICINKRITEQETLLNGRTVAAQSTALYRQVKELNRKVLGLLDGLIFLKEEILAHVLNCRMFTMNYPLLLEHIIREAKLYRTYLRELETKGHLERRTMEQTERFWNQIMMEHALFIRGLLDPTEDGLIDAADSFAKDYAQLLEHSRNAQNRTLAETVKFRDFKLAGTKGIQECKIRSIILPLLADHVLREANHYIRLLNM